MKSKQNKERKNIGRAKKPKKVDLLDNIELTTSPFHKIKTGIYLNKKGELKNYAIFKKKTDDELFNKETVLGTKEKQIKVTSLFLNKNGDLYREPKDKYCYPIVEKSNRHKIIRFLATNTGYQFRRLISIELDIKDEKTVSTEIGKMRNNIKKYLKINGKDLLQGKKGSGYRINPKYRITFKNE